MNELYKHIEGFKFMMNHYDLEIDTGHEMKMMVRAYIDGVLVGSRLGIFTSEQAVKLEDILMKRITTKCVDDEE